MNYDTIEGVTEALRNINFSVDEGEFISIIGPSGCGKSTLLNIISGILTPSSGEVKYNDPQIKTNLDKMGYMFQKDYLFP
ncbi:MAG: ATP-binding cassette domain-containing protein, partial [Clostridium celatum]|nr:ATP-binding cassette domain-containing protein [Clostridium celatum]